MEGAPQLHRGAAFVRQTRRSWPLGRSGDRSFSGWPDGRMISFPELSLVAPPGSIVGVLEEGAPHLAATAPCDVVPATQPFPSEPGSYLLDHWFAKLPRVPKALGLTQLESLRR